MHLRGSKCILLSGVFKPEREGFLPNFCCFHFTKLKCVTSSPRRCWEKQGRATDRGVPEISPEKGEEARKRENVSPPRRQCLKGQMVTRSRPMSFLSKDREVGNAYT